MNISLGVTTWNSANWIKRQFEKNYFDMSSNLIDEIVIQDDCSSDYEALKHHESDNVKIFKNDRNLSPLLSRKNLVNNCKNDWVLVMDSDNFLKPKSDNGVDCFSVLRSIEKSNDTIYCPCFLHHQSYNDICGKLYSMEDIQKVFDDHYIPTFLNTGNFLVPRENYLRVCEDIDPQFLHYTVDVIYFMFLWLKRGFKIQCVNEYEYDHTIRDDSFTNTCGSASSSKLQEVYTMFRTYENN